MLRIFAGLFCLLVVVGCSSGKTDWPVRVGNYSYDNAVKEMGPPDKTETLTDGTRVADWFVTRRGGMTVSLGLASFGGNTAVGTGTKLGTVGARPMLRLTFGADGKLVSAQELGR